MRRLLLLMVLTLLIVPAAAQAQNDAPPYLMYYSRALDGWIIERADGTDSRIIGQGLVPENQRWIDGPGWSPSGEWFAWISSEVTYYGWKHASRGYVMHVDGSYLHEFDAGGTVGGYAHGVNLEWSPNADILFILTSHRASEDEDNHDLIVSASLLDMSTGATLAVVDTTMTPYRNMANNLHIVGWSSDGSAAAFYTLVFNEDTQTYEHWGFMLSPSGEVRCELIASEPVGYIYSLGWSGQTLVFYYELDEGGYVCTALFSDGRRTDWQNTGLVGVNLYDEEVWIYQPKRSWGPDGWLATVSPDHETLMLRQIATGTSVDIPLPSGVTGLELSWHPTEVAALVGLSGISGGLYLLADGRLTFVDDAGFADRRDEILYVLPSQRTYEQYDSVPGLWSPDGQWAVYATSDTTYALFNFETRASQEILTTFPNAYLRWSPDSSRLVFHTSLDDAVEAHFYNLATGTFDLDLSYEISSWYTNANLFWTDGRYFLHQEETPSLRNSAPICIDMQTGDTLALPAHSSANRGVGYFRWSSDEQWVITGSIFFIAGGDAPYRETGIMRPDGSGWRELGMSIFSDAGPNWLPDRVDVSQLPPGQPDSLTPAPVAFDYEQGPGMWVWDTSPNLFVVCEKGRRQRVQDRATEDLILTLNDPGQCAESYDTLGAISPDGTLLALADNFSDGLALWSIPDGQQLVWVDTVALSIRFSEDGRWLYTTALQAELTWDLNQILRE